MKYKLLLSPLYKGGSDKLNGNPLAQETPEPTPLSTVLCPPWTTFLFVLEVCLQRYMKFANVFLSPWLGTIWKQLYLLTF